MYDSFATLRPHFNALARSGYFKRVLKREDKWKDLLHYYYRIFIWFFVGSYNIQHIIRAVQGRHDTNQLVGTLFILLTSLNAFGKQIYFNVRACRIDNIISIITGETFASSHSYHESVMRNNASVMARLLKICHLSVFVCGALFVMYPIVDKALGNEVYLTGYMPFDTTTSPAFEIAGVYMGLNITLQGYGHMSMDCTIVAFYAFMTTQLKILRYNLENFVGDYKVKSYKQYVDDDAVKIVLKDKFVRYVKHYIQIVWCAKEIESIFNEAILINFLVLSWVVCMTVYKIGVLAIFSAEFLTMASYLSCMLLQLFIYCYFGTLLKSESELINESIYQSDWLSLSPGFRRYLIVLMERGKRPILPQIVYVIPLSMDTYIQVLRMAYALYTILAAK